VTELNWYAVYTRPSHEKRVGAHFASRDIEFFLPTYRTTRRWKNRCKVELAPPLFPTYIFARVAWREHARILDVPSVISIVGNGRQPLPLPNSEVEALRSGLTLVRTQPHPYLNVGERVRIKSGPLAGMEGIVLREGNGLRVVLTVELIMRSIVIEVEQWDLETVN
jgi:transcription antitermination factor NusG